MRYVELNGRQKGHPWSLRQTGVYHKTQLSGQQSTWVVLQPSKHARTSLIPSLEKNDAGNITCKAPNLHVHFVFLYSGIKNWHAYVEYMEAQLRRYVSNRPPTPVYNKLLMLTTGRKGSVFAPRHTRSLRPYRPLLRHPMSNKAQKQTINIHGRGKWATQSPARLESPTHPPMRHEKRLRRKQHSRAPEDRDRAHARRISQADVQSKRVQEATGLHSHHTNECSSSTLYYTHANEYQLTPCYDRPNAHTYYRACAHRERRPSRHHERQDAGANCYIILARYAHRRKEHICLCVMRC